ncbi:helix-turn-helix domain-containing protein [Aquabacter sp. CN5-332]|uniref:winged helix-turn-helix transcriptional regulator n=1 Tax=Aquabacter sp. CN5-332 TaxID=3156608 RepID=UPI0032B3C82C
MEKETIEPCGDDQPCCEGCTPSSSDISHFQNAIRTIVGKWKVEIVFTLISGPRRFGEIRRALPGITQHTLTAQLRELEGSGLLVRTAYAEIPPRVDYELTDAAYALLPVFKAMLEWSRRYGAQLEAHGTGTAALTP